MHFDGDRHYAESRLGGTYIWDTDKRQMVNFLHTDSFPDGSMGFWVRGRTGSNYLMRPEHFSFAPPEIGAYNSAYADQAFYVSRIPVRRDWRQGMRANQYQISGSATAVRS